MADSKDTPHDWTSVESAAPSEEDSVARGTKLVSELLSAPQQLSSGSLLAACLARELSVLGDGEEELVASSMVGAAAAARWEWRSSLSFRVATRQSSAWNSCSASFGWA